MTTRAFALAVTALALIAPPALAGSVSVTGGALTYAAAPGEANDVQVLFASDRNSYIVTDSAGLAVGPGCTEGSSPGVAECAGDGVSSVSIDLGDGNDTGSTDPFPAPMVMHGGPGDDMLIGHGTFFGDEGDDYLVGGSRPDTFTGGPGHDRIEAEREDTIDCQGDADDIVKPFAKPILVNCPDPPSLRVTAKHVSVKKFLAGKLTFTAHCSSPCAIAFKLIAPPKLRAYVHHGGGNIEAHPIALDDAAFLALGPTTQSFHTFVDGPATAKALSRLHKFKLDLRVDAHSGQNRVTTRTISVPIG